MNETLIKSNHVYQKNFRCRNNNATNKLITNEITKIKEKELGCSVSKYGILTFIPK